MEPEDRTESYLYDVLIEHAVWTEREFSAIVSDIVERWLRDTPIGTGELPDRPRLSLACNHRSVGWCLDELTDVVGYHWRVMRQNGRPLIIFEPEADCQHLYCRIERGEEEW